MKRLSLPLWLNAALLYLFLYAPIAVVIVYSFNSAKRGGPWQGFTTEWYATLLHSPEKLSAVRNTVVLAVSSTAVSTVLGTLLGHLSRYVFPGKKLFSWLMYIPVVVPDFVAAVAMLMFYSFVREWTGLLELGLTTRGLLAPLRHENIPNLKNIDPRFSNPPFNPSRSKREVLNYFAGLRLTSCHHRKKWPKLNATKKQFSPNGFIVGTFLRSGCQPMVWEVGDQAPTLVWMSLWVSGPGSVAGLAASMGEFLQAAVGIWPPFTPVAWGVGGHRLLAEE